MYFFTEFDYNVMTYVICRWEIRPVKFLSIIQNIYIYSVYTHTHTHTHTHRYIYPVALLCCGEHFAGMVWVHLSP